MKKFLMIFLVLLFVIPLANCGRVVPPGTTVILVEPDGSNQVKDSGAFRVWGRTRAYYVDGKIRSYPKDLKILCSDNINMDVSVKWIGSFKVTKDTIETIKRKVPAQEVKLEGSTVLALSLDKFFNTAMSDILSSITREIISPYNTDNIRPNRAEIRKAIKTAFVSRMQELRYPVETADILITNIDFPPKIKAKREAIKDAELQDLENAAIAKASVAKAKRNAELEAEMGKAALVKAEADAACNRVRAKSLTPEILAVKQLETLVKLAEGPNNTVVVIPFSAIRPGGMQDMLINKDAVDRLQKALRGKK